MCAWLQVRRDHNRRRNTSSAQTGLGDVARMVVDSGCEEEDSCERCSASLRRGMPGDLSTSRWDMRIHPSFAPWLLRVRPAVCVVIPVTLWHGACRRSPSRAAAPVRWSRRCGDGSWVSPDPR